MAVKNQRVRLYVQTDTGTGGRSAMSYQLVPSDASDMAYWAAVSFVSGRNVTVGGQGEAVVIYDVTTSTTVPIDNTTVGVFTVMPDETQILAIQSVGQLFNTGEQQARCLDVSDATYTLTV